MRSFLLDSSSVFTILLVRGAKDYSLISVKEIFQTLTQKDKKIIFEENCPVIVKENYFSKDKVKEREGTIKEETELTQEVRDFLGKENFQTFSRILRAKTKISMLA